MAAAPRRFAAAEYQAFRERAFRERAFQEQRLRVAEVAAAPRAQLLLLAEEAPHVPRLWEAEAEPRAPVPAAGTAGAPVPAAGTAAAAERQVAVSLPVPAAAL